METAVWTYHLRLYSMMSSVVTGTAAAVMSGISISIVLDRIGIVCAALGGIGTAGVVRSRLLCSNLTCTCLTVCGKLAGRRILPIYSWNTVNGIVTGVTESIVIGIRVIGAVTICNVAGNTKTGAGTSVMTGMVSFVPVAVVTDSIAISIRERAGMHL